MNFFVEKTATKKWNQGETREQDCIAKLRTSRLMRTKPIAQRCFELAYEIQNNLKYMSNRVKGSWSNKNTKLLILPVADKFWLRDHPFLEFAKLVPFFCTKHFLSVATVPTFAWPGLREWDRAPNWWQCCSHALPQNRAQPPVFANRRRY